MKPFEDIQYHFRITSCFGFVSEGFFLLRHTNQISTYMNLEKSLAVSNEDLLF